VPGAVLVAETERFWSVVRIEQVDDDGQVHFVPVPPDDPVAVHLLTRSAYRLRTRSISPEPPRAARRWSSTCGRRTVNDLPFETFELQVSHTCTRPAGCGHDPLDDLLFWNSTLGVDRQADDEHPALRLTVASAELIAIRPSNSPFDIHTLLDAVDGEVDRYQQLYDDEGELLVEVEGYGDGLVLANRVVVDAAYRGRGFGPLLLAEALHDLSDGLALAACEPAPLQLDAESDPAAWETGQARLRSLWTGFGFQQFGGSSLWVMDLATTNLTQTLAELRADVLAGDPL